jgi:pimeloyl-ACP methyl ester carboxylesterase
MGATGEGNCEDWCRDVETAVDELRDITGLTKVGLIGLRLGATLATRVAVKHAQQIDALVLWDPVSGKTTATSEATIKSSARTNIGITTTKNAEDKFAQINASPACSSLPKRTLVLLTCNTPPYGEFGELEVEYMIAEPAWSEERVIDGTMPVNVVQRIAQWIK